MRVLINRRASSLSIDKFRKNRRGTQRLIKEVSCFLLVCLCLALTGAAVRNSRQSSTILTKGVGQGNAAAVSHPQQQQQQHILVVDCGSTGTRINIIRREYDDDGVGGLGGEPRFTAVNWQDFGVAFGDEEVAAGGKKKHGYNRVETLPGIHRAVLEGKGLAGVKDALEPLLDWADRAIPRLPSHEKLPIFLFATAGVRKLESEQQEALMAHIRQVLSSSAFHFQPDWAKIITGEDEGIFSWVSANYKLGNLKKSGDDAVQAQAQAMNMLELGGSSLQVSYVMDSPESQKTREVKAFGRTYHLQVESFNGYGMNDAFNSSLTSLSSSSQEKEGKEEKKDTGEASDARVLIHPCLQKDFTYRGEGNTTTYEGRFDLEECREVIHKAAEEHANAVQVYQDQVVQNAGNNRNSNANFIALAGFFLVYSFFEIPLSLPVSEMSKRVQGMCENVFEGLSEEEKEDGNAGLYCFRFVYAKVILNDWLGLADDQIHIFQASEWALGAAILLQREFDFGQGTMTSGVASAESGQDRRRVPSFVVMSSFGAGLVLLCLSVLLFLVVRRRKHQQGGLKRSASNMVLPIWTKANLDGSASNKYP